MREIVSTRLRLAAYVATVEEDRSSFKMLKGKPSGKRSLRSDRRKWEGNIRMELKEISINTSNWVVPAQDRDYWTALVDELPGPEAIEF